MGFFRSILLLVSLVCAIIFPYFVGYGLASHHSNWIGYGAVFGVIAGVLFFLQGRMGREAEVH